jgi:hypothetical protein
MRTRYFAAMYPARSVPHYIKQCRVIVGKMPQVAGLQSPPIPYATVTDHIDTLDDLEQAAHKCPVGAASDRDAALLVVESDMRQLKAFLQSVGDQDQAAAPGLFQDAGFSVGKKSGPGPKQDIEAKRGDNAGTVVLSARASKKRRVDYLWQMSVDQTTWSSLPSTLRASTLVSGLTAGTVYYFRVQTKTVDGLSDWSAIVCVMAH